MRCFFEDCVLDTERRELRRGPAIVPTTPQVLDLLEFLIRSRDRVVSKDDLVNAIWNGRIVSDAALTTRLNAVRRAIGDSGQQQRLIKTFPRKGFRFVGVVHDEDRQPATAAAVTIPVASSADVDERQSARWLENIRGRLKLVGRVLALVATIGAIAGGLVGYWNVWKTVRTDAGREAQNIQKQPTIAPEIEPRLSLVVLPFTNLNDDPAQDTFAESLSTDLATDLARTPATRVIGRDVAFSYKKKAIDLQQLGTDLRIRWAVRGAVRRNGDQVRVNVSLTDLRTARDIWSDRFDDDLANLAALHGTITARLLCVAHLHLRQYEEALQQCSRSLNMSGTDYQAYMRLISAFGSTGRNTS
ncbi:winged helix-turn-helix domain-containing protein [Bradyrhizobium yuanmingense]|uniref:winged helix-turn-helix domain-containing protein n=1 Tax=Bradyrhizobium yuanmingense TaxID=108015 RepID=UPI0023B90499|nr:winged helix-turn-helix domain-containing protein [Bradyrhizobium yuanmingense]MDF0521272.1 winged helix-turn-helix domain-containing protein [Bradyrhizobium yuanmingense]